MLETREFARVIAIDGDRRGRMRLMSRILKWQDFETELICLVKDMSESKIKPRFLDDELMGMVVSPRVTELRSENLLRCESVPMRRNSVFDGFRSSLLRFIQDKMSLNVEDKMESEFVTVLSVKEM